MQSKKLKPDIITSPRLESLTPSERILFIALLMMSDKNGKFEWDGSIQNKVALYRHTRHPMEGFISAFETLAHKRLIDSKRMVVNDILCWVDKESLGPTKHYGTVPPTVDDVREYCLERKSSVDPDVFVDFYESKGWLVGKVKMKDWKAAVRTWERSEYRKEKPAPKKEFKYAL